MLKEYVYDRNKAVSYAREWAFKRNRRYLNFDELGGDCTNFASQCLLAGSGVMNFQAVFGWYYISAADRTASWTGVGYLSDFLLGNDGEGPYAAEVALNEVMPGDIVQLGDGSGRFFHSPIVCGLNEKNGLLLAAHTYDRWMYPLNDYYFQSIRCLHILGYRK